MSTLPPPGYPVGPILCANLSADTVFERPYTLGQIETARPVLVRHAVDASGASKVREVIMPDNQPISASTSVWPATGWHPSGWVLNFGLWWSPVAEANRFPPAEDNEDFKTWGGRVKTVYAGALPGMDKVTADEWKAIWAKKEADRKARQEAVEAAKKKAADAAEASRLKRLAAAGGLAGRTHSPRA